MRRAVNLAASLVLACTLAGCAGSVGEGVADGAPAIDAADLKARLDTLLEPGRPDGIRASVWVGGPTGAPWFTHEPGVVRAAASAIKTAYLVEWFDLHRAALDAPVEGAVDIVADTTHPAVAHFEAGQLEEIRREIGGASARRIGQMMIRGTDVSNVVYNAAANVVAALLGGPAELTERIRARDAAFDGLTVRRYMLAARDATGDNEATAESLAAVLQRIASRRLPGVDDETARAIRKILRLPDDDGAGRGHYFKSGSLNSDPLVRIRSGFWDLPEGIVVYVVIVEQPDPAALPRDEAGARLDRVSRKTADAVVRDARLAMRAARDTGRPDGRR
ncbi:MAG: hypothetical protein QF463_04830 [Vicinamibacterales bacterium]|jgi:hypothetical protein|nr:hypothetical protein [Acidobacteriota bacterium]MDP6370912.1 hypothetical protein [Vicinamibacterales bacterium]MDP6608372.1 hypothetical protein [Vicinamibacterales bacterium]HAK53997.1 hypothetical protein [Acidobacteriota bacterium]|tara:strand:+ start:630 stop:1631 length:1002 start_codon:yes stop_codon:yes gene_type:complete